MKTILRTMTLLVLLASGIFTSSAQLPSVQLKDLNGKSVDSATLNNDGKPFIISFWATWCKPCIRELKAINEVYEDWVEETGVKVYAISIDDAQNANKVKPFVTEKGWEYETLLDPNSDFARSMGAQNVPHVVVVGKNGEILESHSGYNPGSEDHLIELVRKNLAK